MTHDELLTKIELTLGTYISKYYGSKKDVELRSDVIDSLQALRAVVELHKPLNSLWYKQIICESCQEGNDYPITYPCPTIEAIEEQIK